MGTYGLLTKREMDLFFLRNTTRNPERTRMRHFARLGSLSQGKIWVIFPAHGASHSGPPMTHRGANKQCPIKKSWYYHCIVNIQGQLISR